MYNDKTIVEGKEIPLTKEETANVAKFHLSRVAFAFIGKALAVTSNDKREHRVYLREDFGIDDETFETLIRGYIKPGRIVLYVTSSFAPIDDVSDELLCRLAELAKTSFGPGKYEVWNGVSVGKIGEEWTPIQVIGSIET